MLKYMFAVSVAVVVVAGIGYAAQSSSVVVEAPKTDATNGREMYMSYCASCHGVDGRGNGPTAATLKNRPVDLTILSKKNHGKFPSSHIASVLQFGAPTPWHGSAAMPVWGPLFTAMNDSNEREMSLRIGNLSRFLESIQAR